MKKTARWILEKQNKQFRSMNQQLSKYNMREIKDH